MTVVTVVGTGLTATLVFFFCLVDALPFGVDSVNAAECIFGSGRGVPPVWGELLRLFWESVDGTPAFRMGLVSALAGGVATGAVAYAVRRAFMLAVSNSKEESPHKDSFLLLVGPVAALFFASIPKVFAAATHVGPYAAQLALAFLAMALTLCGTCLSASEASGRLRTGAIGFVAGLAAVEGLPGLVALPFVVALVWFNLVKRLRLGPMVVVIRFAFGFALAVGLGLVLGWTWGLPSVRLSVIWLFLAGVAITAICGAVRRRGVTVDAFVLLAVALSAAGVQMSMCVRNRGAGCAADAYVRGLVPQDVRRRLSGNMCARCNYQ